MSILRRKDPPSRTMIRQKSEPILRVRRTSPLTRAVSDSRIMVLQKKVRFRDTATVNPGLQRITLKDLDLGVLVPRAAFWIPPEPIRPSSKPRKRPKKKKKFPIHELETLIDSVKEKLAAESCEMCVCTKRAQRISLTRTIP
jgi:hypothetical protein